MMLLLICATIITADEHLFACTVNIGDGVRPLPRNRREAESGPYSTMWNAAIADELESIRERDVRGPLEHIPDYVRRVIGTTFVFRWKVPNVEEESSDSAPPEPKAKVRGCAQDFNFFSLIICMPRRAKV